MDLNRTLCVTRMFRLVRPVRPFLWTARWKADNPRQRNKKCGLAKLRSCGLIRIMNPCLRTSCTDPHALIHGFGWVGHAQDVECPPASTRRTAEPARVCCDIRMVFNYRCLITYQSEAACIETGPVLVKSHHKIDTQKSPPNKGNKATCQDPKGFLECFPTDRVFQDS